MFSDIVFRWLDVALDYGISEHDFWEMTIAELERAINSQKRVQKREAQERASFDYILADLVGRSISRIYNSTNNIPSISEVYPTLFDSKEYEEAKSVKQDELSALRFRQFAQSFNKRFKGVSNKDE